MSTCYGDATRGVGLLASELGFRTWRPEERTPTYAMSLPLVRFDWILASPELRIVGQETLLPIASPTTPRWSPSSRGAESRGLNRTEPSSTFGPAHFVNEVSLPSPISET